LKRVKLTISYDGTNYCGWQTQQNGITVEEVINRELSRLLKEDIKVIGASRTDSGVHARGNVAVFDTNARIPSEKISYAMNQALPDDIKVQNSVEVADDFHPRYQPCQKTYEYSIYNASFPMPMERLYSHFTYHPLDIDKMRKAAGYLIGEHDFKSFCTVGAQVQTTVRTIYDITISKELISSESGRNEAGCISEATKSALSDNFISAENKHSMGRIVEPGKIFIRITGNGFLYNMVRIIAGTLMEVGQGKYPPERMIKIIEAKDRRLAGPTASACGLTLLEIKYESDEKTP